MQGFSSNKPFLKALFLIALIIVAFWIASYFPDIVLTIIISVLLAFVLKPVVRFLEFRLMLKRNVAIALIFLFIGGIIALSVIELAPIAIEKIKGMYATCQTFPFEQKLSDVTKDVAAKVPFVNQATITQKVEGLIQSALASIGAVIASATGFLVNIVIIPFITYFILADGDAAVKKFVEKIPNKYFEMTLNVMYTLKKELVSYLRGLMMESCIVGGLTMIGLTIIGVPYGLLIGVIAGIANIVPYLGVIFGAGIAIFISLVEFGSFQMLFPILLLTLIVRLIDDLLLQPICFGKSLDMHPVVVVLVLLIGDQLMGVAGMVISIPIATILRVTATETYWGLKHYSITA
jgi:predicted PurR-regulated permease PerM